jgi:ABC-type transporter Mla subunit MlaD
MTTDEKLDRVAENLDRLTAVVSTLASSVAAHDNQIDALIRIAEKHSEQIAAMQRQWQAYINTLPRQ